MGPADLDSITGDLQKACHEQVLVGLDTSDDAGVVRVRDDLAIVATVDIITPLCDDPWLYGAIAAANSVSDVFAMGGEPVGALNVCCFPAGVPREMLQEILRGGREKIEEAGAAVIGGHTVQDEELKFGCSVTGVVHPDRIIRNAGARPGDALVLTKPIGTGVIIGGYRKGLLGDEDIAEVGQVMATLNAVAGRLMYVFGVHAATDVTGFGLAGHGFEMARGSGGVGLRFHYPRVPRFERALEMIGAGVKTRMTAGNRDSIADLTIAPALSEEEATLFWDPQTSGGMLMALPPDKAEALVARLREEGVEHATVIGEVFASDRPAIEIVSA